MRERANIPILRGKMYLITGGVGQVIEGTHVGADRVHAELVDGKPMLAWDTAWYRFHVPGVPEDVLVPIENIVRYA